MKLYDVIISEKKRTTGQNISVPPPDNEWIPRRTPKSFKRHIIVYGILFAVIAIIYVLGVLYAHTTVTVYERRVPFTLDATTIDLTHTNTSANERLTYQAMVVTDTLTRDVFGSEVVVKDVKAKGQVVFFNEYSKTAQSIASGTTLLSTDGRKYILAEKITVPGYTTPKNSTTKQPGTSKPVTVTASATGSDYNTSGTSFTVAAYTGAKKTQLYARSSTGITGGESGGRHTVPANERETIITSLKTQLAERLKRQTRPQIPEGFITYPELQLFSVDDHSLILEGQDIKFPASLSGSLVTYLIPKEAFEQAVARLALGERTFPKVAIPTSGDFEVAPVSVLPVSGKDFPDTISISVAGQGTIIAKTDQDSLKQTLIGIKRNTFETALQNIEEIDHATYTMIPFWAPFFPSKTDRITVVVK